MSLVPEAAEFRFASGFIVRSFFVSNMLVNDCAVCETYKFLPLGRLCRECLVEESITRIAYECSADGEAELIDEFEAVFEDVDELDFCSQNGTFVVSENWSMIFSVDPRKVNVHGHSFKEGKSRCQRFQDYADKVGIEREYEFKIKSVSGFIKIDPHVVEFLEDSEEYGALQSDDDVCNIGDDSVVGETVQFLGNTEAEYRAGVERFLSLASKAERPE